MGECVNHWRRFIAICRASGGAAFVALESDDLDGSGARRLVYTTRRVWLGDRTGKALERGTSGCAEPGPGRGADLARCAAHLVRSEYRQPVHMAVVVGHAG